jgi:hypothetical protein
VTRNYTVILENLQKEIEKLREEGELPEVLDIIRQIERANERLKQPLICLFAKKIQK